MRIRSLFVWVLIVKDFLREDTQHKSNDDCDERGPDESLAYKYVERPTARVWKEVGWSLRRTTSRRLPFWRNQTQAGPEPERPDILARLRVKSFDDRGFKLLLINPAQTLQRRDIVDELPAALWYRGSEVKHEGNNKTR